MDNETQDRFEARLVSLMEPDIAYSTIELLQLLDINATATGSALHQYHRKLFRATINKKIRHLQKSRLHFWSTGKFVMKE